MIRELRILPPLAIGRFGGAPTPMDNYDAVVDPDRPLAHRTLRLAETLEVDLESGKIARAFVPERLSFTEDGPEIRLRFTPAAGQVYGSSESAPDEGPPSDPNVFEVLYDANRGGWPRHSDAGPGTTTPGNIYAGRQVGEDWVSLGYLDDGCDGIVHAELKLGDKVLSAAARFAAGPPAYAPDSAPVRTVADELEQALLGPAVQGDEASLERVEEIVRRAFETIRLMNTAAMNVGGMAGHDRGAGRRPEPIMAPSLVDEVALENLHQSLLVALRSGTAPWFADVLRDYDEIGDLSDRGRRKMPAMMRGADGRHLTLTRRQIDLIRTLARGPIFPDGEGGSP